MVIPCFNEALRLRSDSFSLLAATGMHLLFVDDGSGDDTAILLEELAATSALIELIVLPKNVGKGEAVRQGLRHALRGPCAAVGYIDADLSAPPSEMLRLVAALDNNPQYVAVLGSRVARLGARIERSNARHYGGRAFATIASIALGCRVYDTQCGAKVFRATPALRAALDQPFRSAWAFDVELLGRLLHGCNGVRPVRAEDLLELPLSEWREVAGSTMHIGAKLRTLGEVSVMIFNRCR